MASISLYKISDNPKKMSKTLGTALYTSTTMEPYMPLSDLTGTVLLAYSADYMPANYAKLNGKYYFITDRVLEPGNKLRLYLKIDVLMTHATEIKQCPAVFDRSDCFTNQLLADGMERVSVRSLIEYIPFSPVVSGHEFKHPSSYMLITHL